MKLVSLGTKDVEVLELCLMERLKNGAFGDIPERGPGLRMRQELREGRKRGWM